MIVNRPKKEDRTVRFLELPVGAGFRWKNWYYMKIERCQCSQDVAHSGPPIERYCNAVQLETGLLAYFDGEFVEKIPMSIEVLE